MVNNYWPLDEYVDVGVVYTSAVIYCVLPLFYFSGPCGTKLRYRYIEKCVNLIPRVN